MQENHVDAPCKFCNKGFPKQEVISHMAKCEEKPSECKFCHLQITFKEKKDHEYVCGSKTEYCSNCKKYIPVKDFEAHLDIQCYPDDTYLSNHLNVEIIPKIMNKRNSKLGKIAEAKKLGILGSQKESEDNNKNIHNDLAKKIEALEKNKSKGGDIDKHNKNDKNDKGQKRVNAKTNVDSDNIINISNKNPTHFENYNPKEGIKTGNVVKAGNVKVSFGSGGNANSKVHIRDIRDSTTTNTNYYSKHTGSKLDHKYKSKEPLKENKNNMIKSNATSNNHINIDSNNTLTTQPVKKSLPYKQAENRSSNIANSNCIKYNNDFNPKNNILDNDKGIKRYNTKENKNSSANIKNNPITNDKEKEKKLKKEKK